MAHLEPIYVQIIIQVMTLIAAFILGVVTYGIFRDKSPKRFYGDVWTIGDIVKALLTLGIAYTVFSLMLLCGWRFMTTGDLNAIDFLTQVITLLSPYLILALAAYGISKA